MTYRYHLHTTTSDGTHEYSTFDEASRAIASSLVDEAEPWELVRTDDSPEPWTLILCGAGHSVPSRTTMLRHYPPPR